MRKEIRNFLTMQQEMGKLLAVGAQLSKLGENLSNKLKGGLSLQDLDISIREVCKIDLSKVSTKTGADYRGCNYKVNPDVEFTPPMIIRIRIDDDC